MTDASIYDFPHLYDLMVGVGPCEAFYRNLARRTGQPVLELACGTGRLTIPLALDGFEVVALDISPKMLAAARAKAESEDVEIKFIQGDMRAFDLGQRFALVIVSCNSLGHLMTNDELKGSLCCIHRHLAAGGILAFDVINPQVTKLSAAHVECVQASSEITVEEVATYDPVQQVRHARWRVLQPGRSSRKLAPLSLRQFFPQEVPLLLELAGLELIARYGDFDCSPLTAASANQICLAHPPIDR